MKRMTINSVALTLTREICIMSVVDILAAVISYFLEIAFDAPEVAIPFLIILIPLNIRIAIDIFINLSRLFWLTKKEVMR